MNAAEFQFGLGIALFVIVYIKVVLVVNGQKTAVYNDNDDY